MSRLAKHHRLLLAAAAVATLPFGVAGVATAQPPDAPPGHGPGLQGKSPSTPDQDGIGADKGVDNDDKPGGRGDVDGNNGCGNDDDREDDNNGNCGRPAGGGTPPTSPPPTTGGQQPTGVLSGTLTRGTTPGGTASAATRSAAGAVSGAATAQKAPAVAVQAQPTFTG